MRMSLLSRVISSVVERLLYTQDVTGSNPVLPMLKFKVKHGTYHIF